MQEKPQKELQRNQVEQNQLINIVYYTDPLCCWCWAFEPVWQRLKKDLQGKILWRYCMSGLLPNWRNYHDDINSVSKPIQMGPIWKEAQQTSGVEMNDRIWFEDPPDSSYPSCVAVKAAALQGRQAEELYLVALREAVMQRGKNISKRKILIELATELSGEGHSFDALKFGHDLSSETAIEAFRKDVQEAAYLHITRFPTLFITHPQKGGFLITGYRPYSVIAEIFSQLSPELMQI